MGVIATLLITTAIAGVVGTGLGARHGILIRSGEILEITHSIDTVVLDKTGTVTQGKPTVSSLIPCKLLLWSVVIGRYR